MVNPVQFNEYGNPDVVRVLGDKTHSKDHPIERVVTDRRTRAITEQFESRYERWAGDLDVFVTVYVNADGIQVWTKNQCRVSLPWDTLDRMRQEIGHAHDQ